MKRSEGSKGVRNRFSRPSGAGAGPNNRSGDGKQRPLVPRSRCLPRLSRSVRLHYRTEKVAIPAAIECHTLPRDLWERVWPFHDSRGMLALFIPVYPEEEGHMPYVYSQGLGILYQSMATAPARLPHLSNGAPALQTLSWRASAGGRVRAGAGPQRHRPHAYARESTSLGASPLRQSRADGRHISPDP